MKKNLILYLIFFIHFFSFSQSAISEWDKKYTLQNPRDIIKYEINYANKIEKDTTEQGHYYLRTGAYRFLATFTGNKRNIPIDKLNSMKRVFKVKYGNNYSLDELVQKEFEFESEGKTYWFSIQTQLIDDVYAEVKKNQKILLYVLFINEHLYKGELINQFLISEFSTTWN